MDIFPCLQELQPPCEASMAAAQARLDRLAIPRGSLGRLMEIGRRVAGIRRCASPRITTKRIITFAADHGVSAEGVSAFAREVTREMVFNFMRGGAGINVLARHAGAEVCIVDIGVDYDFDPMPGLVIRKIARGTRNLAVEPAMTREQAVQALQVGFDLAREAARDNVDLLGTGDMGIGNTTPSSALLAALCSQPVAEVTSRGTGIDDAALARKISVIERALALHGPLCSDPIDVLARLGGLEIAGIAGLILGAAAEHIPVVVDGFISTAGALVAHALNPLAVDYMFAAHLSVEKGHRCMLDHLGLRPLLDLDLRLGEGTGAALGMPVIEAGVKVLNEMLTFEEAGVTEGDRG